MYRSGNQIKPQLAVRRPHDTPGAASTATDTPLTPLMVRDDSAPKPLSTDLFPGKERLRQACRISCSGWHWHHTTRSLIASFIISLACLHAYTRLLCPVSYDPFRFALSSFLLAIDCPFVRRSAQRVFNTTTQRLMFIVNHDSTERLLLQIVHRVYCSSMLSIA